MILSALNPLELYHAISNENTTLLKAVKGVGLKTAQRIIVELKDKIKLTEETGSVTGSVPAMNATIHEEALSALTMLGFAAPVSQKTVIAILKEEPEATVERVIKLALKRL
jgi:Holliday junction DNA helicase RuvA